MSIRRRILGAAAALLLVCGVSAADTVSAHAATPSCGSECISLFSNLYGTTANPHFVLDVRNQVQAAGQPIILAPTSNANPGEDFQVDAQATVEDFSQIGLVSAGLAAVYASSSAYELQYEPYGVATGLCVGVGATPTNGTQVSLQPCGVSGKTIWIVDSNQTITGSGYSLINAGTAGDFAKPYVLSAGLPGGSLFTWTLTSITLFHYTFVLPNQLWGGISGILL